MESKEPLILVSNDDGVMAKGISELVKFLRPLGEIVVMAPDSPRSGSGSALTVTHPVQNQHRADDCTEKNQSKEFPSDSLQSLLPSFLNNAR